MADSLKWIFELVDKMSGPARKIAQSVAAVEANLATVKRAAGVAQVNTNKQSKANGMLAASFGKLTSAAALGSMLADAAGAAWSAMAGAASRALDLGVAGAQFAVNAVSFKEDALIGLEAITKSRSAANRIFDNAIKLAEETPFQQNEIIGVVQGLLSSGFKENELDRTVRALADIASVKGDASLTQRLALIMAQVKGKGRLQGEELMQLSEAGLPMAQVVQQISKQMGKSTDEVQKLITAGKVNSDIATEAIISAVEANFGGASQARSKALSGLLSTLMDKPTNLVTAASSQGGGGVNQFFDGIKSIVQRLNDSLDPNTEFGGRIIAVINDVASAFASILPSADTVGSVLQYILQAFEMITPDVRMFAKSIGEAFGGFEDAGDGTNMLGNTLRVIVRIATSLVPIIGGIVDGFKAAVGPVMALFSNMDPTKSTDSLRFLGQVVGSVLGSIVNLMVYIAAIPAAFGAMAQFFWDIGVAIVEGIANGITAAGTAVYDALSSVLNGAVSWAKSILGIASPSKVFAAFGDYSMQGYIQGLNQPDVNGALQSTLAIPAAGFAQGLGGTTNANTVNVTVPLNLSGADTATAQAAEAAVERILPTALAAAFEQYAAELGAL